MLAHLQGKTLSIPKFGNILEVDSKTVSRYIDTLIGLLPVWSMMTWHENTEKQVIKSPRYYVRDSGILHHLLEITNYDALLSHQVVGKSWEGFVIENIHSVASRLAKTYVYQTSTGAEIDLIIRFAYDDIWAIAIKFGLAPKVNYVFTRTYYKVGATHNYVVYGGNEEFSIFNGVTMISRAGLMRKILQ